jgi:hypothetical protein
MLPFLEVKKLKKMKSLVATQAKLEWVEKDCLGDEPMSARREMTAAVSAVVH